jgi:DNA-binding SARP family transcriptional activator
MDIRILGPLEVEHDGRRVALGPKQQALLAILLVHRGAPVPAERIVEELYSGQPPANAAKTLQVHVSRLRKALGDRSSLQTSAGGYCFSPAPGAVDRERFEELADRGRRALADGDAGLASASLAEALALWRGSPLADFRYADFAQAEIARLEERRLATLEDRLDADLAAGAHSSLVGELEALVRENPLRERLRAQLMLALYRSGRQAEALETFQEARSALVDELGIDPGRALRELERAILQQDPALDLAAAPLAPETTRAEPMPPVLAPTDPDERRSERKTVTVIHARVGVIGREGEHLDPEVLRRLTSRVFGEIAAAIEAHEGTVESVTGDSVTGIFGLPLVHEDDPLRAQRSAEEIQSRLATDLDGEGPGSIELRIGLSTGEVMTGSVRGKQALATGEPLTSAARLAQEAEPGSIALDDTTRRSLQAARRSARRLVSPMVGRERERRRLSDAFDQAVSDQSCQLFTVLGAAGVGKSRLVLEFLDRIDGDVAVARGRCLPYGEGITYWPVLEAVRDVARIEQTTSLEESRSRLVMLLRHDDAPEHLAQRVLETIGLAESEARVDEGFAAISRFFEALGRERPVVVVFDDIHWGEAMFLDLVEHLADWSRGGPILLLCMARPELLDIRPNWAGGKLNATSLLLEPLSEAECTELVANLVGEADLAEEMETRIAEAAEGNPLFVEEMLSMLIDDGLLVREKGRWAAAGDLTTVPVPPTIHALLAARLDQLGYEERAVIERAAVEGKLFHRGSIEELSIEPLRASVATHLGALVRKELIRPEKPIFPAEDGYRFRHLLIRDAAYESIPKEVRAELHERHVDWLATKTTAVEFDEIAGYHLEQAFRYRAELGPVDENTRALGRRAAERLGNAGRRAFMRSDARGGLNLISRAVALLRPQDPLRVELVPNVRVVQGMTDVSWADRVLTEAVEAAATTGDRRLAAQALVQRGLLRLFTDADVTPQELLDVSQRAIDVFEELEDELGLARAWRLAGQAHYLDRRAGPCAQASERALEHARRSGDLFEQREIVEWIVIALLLGPAPVSGALERSRQLLTEFASHPLVQAEIMAATAALAAMQGEMDEAMKLTERAQQIVDDAGGDRIWVSAFWHSFIHLWRGDHEVAELELRHTYESLRALGERSHFSSIAHALASLEYARGRYDDAELLTRECEQASRANDVHSQILWRSIRAKVFARRDAFADAERLAREAVAFGEESDFLLARADAHADLAEVLELAGRSDEAAAAFRRAIELHELKGNLLAARRTRIRRDALS